MTLFSSEHSPAVDRFSLAMELSGRVLFAFIVLAYFAGLASGSEAGWRFEPVTAIAGLFVYLLLQAVLFTRARRQRAAIWAAPVAALADAAAVLGCVASDPALIPPTLVLVLIAALNVGIRGNGFTAVAAIGGAVAVTVSALTLREQQLGIVLDHSSTFLIALLCAALVVFVLLARRRDMLQALNARYADQDMETQMLNRRGFDNAARYLVPLHQRTQLPLVIVLVSLDTKAVQPLDDKTLALVVRQVGDVVRQRARRSDVIARLSPDEFIFMLFDTPLSGGETLARSLLERFNTWVSQQGIDARMTFGMINMPEEPVAIEQLVARARSTVQRAQKHPSAPAVVTAPSL